MSDATLSFTVVDCNNLTVIGTISPTGANGLRDIIFLNNGQYMIVTSTINQRLLFFNRSSAMSYNYDFIGYQNVSCQIRMVFFM